MTTARIIGNKKVNINPSFLPYPDLDEAQVNIFLMAQQLEILGTYSGDEAAVSEAKRVKNSIRPGKDVLEISSTGRFGKYIDSQKPKLWPSMASNYFVGNPSFEDWRDSELAICQEIENQRRNTSWLRFAERNRLKKEFQKCTDRVEYVSNLNNNLGKSAYQPLYNFLDTPLAPGRVITKSVLHENFAGSIAQVTGLSYETISLWMRNGILAANVQKGIGDLQPEDSINVMRVQAPKVGVGEPISGTIAMLSLIIGAIKAALTFINKLIDAFKDTDRAKILAANSNVGNPQWGAQEKDWITNISSNLGITQDQLLLLIGGGAALYLLNN